MTTTAAGPALEPVDAVANAERYRCRRDLRLGLREFAWRFSSLERVRKCGKVAHSADGTVRYIRSGDGVAHVAGVTTCGSVWACPRCSAAIRAGRADDLATGVHHWGEQGGRLAFITLTVPHNSTDALAELWDRTQQAFSALTTGRGWRRRRDSLGVAGMVRAVEVTHGRHGWHPHLHVLVFLEPDAHPDAAALVLAYLVSAWPDAAERAGLRRPSGTHGVNMVEVDRFLDTVRYVSKPQDGARWGVDAEMARIDAKRGRSGSRTPFEMLADAAETGDADDLALWRDYEHASKGRRAIVWSRGLRERCGITTPETSDEDLANRDIGGETLISLSTDEHVAVCRHRGALSALLRAVEDRDMSTARTIVWNAVKAHHDHRYRHRWASVAPPVAPPTRLVCR